MDAEEFRRAALEMVDFITDYIENIRDRPVLPSVEPGYLKSQLPEVPPNEGEPWSDILPDVEKFIMPGMTHWHSPRFHAYFPTAQSYPAILGDMLTGALGCIGFSWIASPACTELEMKVMDWLATMIGLPEHFKFSGSGNGGGVIQGTASEATLVALLGAKARATKLEEKIGESSQLNGLSRDSNNNSQCDGHGDLNNNDTSTNDGSDDADNRELANGQQQRLPFVERLVGYSSELAHSSVERAGLLAGVKIRSLASDDECRLRGETLRRQILLDKANGLVPFFVVCTLGTTSVCTFDHLRELGLVCQEFGLWLHVDAAYAGSAFVCPEYRYLMDGAELCDSFNFNPHKWLLINFDCSAFWIKDSSYMVDAFNVDPIYLKYEQQGKIPDYRHWQIPLGRRFRSLKVWFVVRSYGLIGLQQYIRNHIELAKYFESLVLADKRFIVTHPVVMGLVCFRLKCTDGCSELLVKKINDDKSIHLCPSKVKGTYIIRFAICAKSTNKSDIDYSWKVLTRLTDQILNERTSCDKQDHNLE